MASLNVSRPPLDPRAAPAALRPPAGSRHGQRGWPRSRVLIGSLGAALALAFFVGSALQAGAVYYLTVGELQAKGEAASGERVRVAAKVLGGSIERQNGVVRFTIVDDPSLGAIQPEGQPGILQRLFARRDEADAAPAPAVPGSAAAAAAAGGRQLPVSYRGVVPDVFGPDVDVVVEGKLTTAGTFEATTLLAKCPSRYESK